MVSQARISSSTVLLTVLGAVLLTCGVLFFDWPGSSDSKHFVENVWFLIWAIVLCAQTALWAVIAPPTWRSVVEVYRGNELTRNTLVRALLSAIIVALLIALLVRFSYPAVPGYPFEHHRLKMLLLTGGGFIVATLAFAGIWFVEAVLAAGEHPELEKYMELRDQLRRFLGAAAAIIGLATLAAGGLRTAILSNVEGATFPPEYVLYYGAYLSVVLLIAYAPAHIALHSAGQRLLERLVPMPEEPPPSWAEWQSERSALRSVLEVDAPAGRTLHAGLAIATPFIGSAIGVLLGTRQ